MDRRSHRVALGATACAAALALPACDSGDRFEGVRVAQSTASGPASGAADAAGALGGQPPGAIGGPAAASLSLPDMQFVNKASEQSRFEAEVARLAADRAADPALKAFAQMLATDSTAAAETLRQIASRHRVVLPATLPEDRKTQVDQLAQLSGPDFDRQCAKALGVENHRRDIDEFGKAAQHARSEDVREFAQATLPNLKKHLEAAERLPGAMGKGKG